MKVALGLVLAAIAAAGINAEGAPSQLAPEDAPNIACNDAHVLLESQDGRPACVTPSTAQTLLERGWLEPTSIGSIAVHDLQAETVTIQAGSWTAGEKSEKIVSHIIDPSDYTPCYLPSAISVEVPSEAAVGQPFDVTITPSFEMTPQQLEDYNDLYETNFESTRDMWESVCDSERAFYQIIAPATYKPSGDGVSHVWTSPSYEYYPVFNYYFYNVDRKIEFGGGSTVVQMTIDEPIIFSMSDIADRSNQDYYKFDFGLFEVDAGTLPPDTLGPPPAVVYTDIENDRIAFSDNEFIRAQGETGEPGPDDQLIPRAGDRLGPLVRPPQDGDTQPYVDFPFWLIVEPSWMYIHEDDPIDTIERLGLGKEYLEDFLNEYPEYRDGTRASSASASQSELPDPELPEDHGVSDDVPFEWIAELMEGDFRGEDPAELIKRFGLDDAYVSGFLEAYTQYNSARASSTREPVAVKLQDAASGAQSSSPNLAFVTGKIKFTNNANVTTAVHGVKVCSYDAADTGNPAYKAIFNGRTPACDITDSSGNFRMTVSLTDLQGGTSTPDISTKSFFENDDFKVVQYQKRGATVDINATEVVHQSQYSTTHRDISGPIQNIGTIILSHSDASSRSSYILNSLQPVHDWYQDTVRYDPSKVTIRWTPGHCATGGVGVFPTLNVMELHEMRGKDGTLCPYVVNSPLENPHTLRHEYAHQVQNQAYMARGTDITVDDCGSLSGDPHSPVAYGGPQCAWIEGWAFFMAVAYDNNPVFQPAYMRGQWNFESRTNTETADRLFARKAFATGNQEGNVAAMLYDVVDRTNETGDGISESVSSVWAAFNTSASPPISTVADFERNWDAQRRPSLDGVLALNTMPVDMPSQNDHMSLSDWFNNLNNWTKQGEDDWSSGAPDAGTHPPRFPTYNTVAKADDCDSECMLVLKSGINLSRFTYAGLSLWRYVDDSLDSGEYLKVDVSSNGGTTWTNVFDWQGGRDDDDSWHQHTLNLSSYLTSTDFKVRLVAKMNNSDEDVAVDYVQIFGTLRNTGGGGGGGTRPSPPAPSATLLSEAFSTLDAWNKEGADEWDTDRLSSRNQPPDHTRSNKVAEASDCDTECKLVLKNGIRLSGHSSASLSIWRYVERSLDSGEYLKVDVSSDGGTTWINMFDWQGNRDDDQTWHRETASLSPYLSSTDFKVRLVAKMSSSSEEVYVDDLTITGVRSSTVDTTAPTITAPADVTAEATGTRTTVSLGTAAATDAVDSSPTVTNNAPADGFPLGSTMVTWTATDDAGNSATDTQTVTVQDTTAPAITAPANLNVEAVGSRTTVSLGSATATDIVDSSPTITNNAPAGGFSLGGTTVIWTATDDAGNSATATQIVTIQDTTPPQITAPADVLVEATGPRTPLNIGRASASDLFGPVTVVNNAPSSLPPTYVIVTWTATDANGNRASDTQRVTVRDTTAPSITAPADMTVEASGPLTRVYWGTPIVSDAVDSNPTITNNASSAWFFKGRTVVIWTATDSSGNSATDTQVVTVQDATPLTITVPADITVEATGALTAVSLGSASSSDLYGLGTIVNDAPSLFPLGKTIVTWTATDHKSNVATAEQVVTVQDTTPPTLFVQADVAKHAFPVKPVLLYFTYATDVVDSSLTLTHDAPSSFPEGLTTVTWTATDDSGNVSTGEQKVVVIDTKTLYPHRLFDVRVKAPVVPATVEFDLPLSRGNATAQSGCTPESGSRFEAGTTLVTCVVVNASGRSATALFRVIVEEDLGDAAIAIAAPPDVQAESSTLVALGSATAVSSSDTSPTITNNAPSSFPPGITVVTWTTTDSGGNAATDTQTVTVTGSSQTILSETFDSIWERWDEYGQGQGCFSGRSNPPSTCRVSWWQPTLHTNWRSGSPDNGIHPPGRAAPNRVAEADGCHGFCVLELKDGLDMTGYGSAELSFWRYIDYFPTRTYNDTIGYLRLDVLSDSSSNWKPLAIWGDMSEHAGQWHQETLDLSAYLTSSDFKIRLASFTYNSDFGVMVDDLVVSGTPVARDAPPTVTVSDLAAVKGSSSTIAVSASDPDGDSMSLSMSAGAPSFVTFVDHGSGRGTLTAAPSASDSGSYIVTITATASLLSSSSTLTIAVVDVADTIPPAIVAPPDRTFEATGALTYANLGTPTVSDQSGIAPTVSNNAPAGFALGGTTVTWTATDSAGNSTSDTQHIVVRDTTPPRIETGPWGPVPYGSAFVHDVVAIDAIDGDLTSSVARTGAVNTRSEGNYTVSYSVSDSAGNSAQFSGILQVDDRHAPTISLSGSTNVAVKTGSSFTDPGATATDPFTNAAVPVSVGGDAVNTNVNGTYTVVYSAPDGRGNTGYALRTVTVTPTPDSPPGIYGAIEHPSLQRSSEFGRSIAVLDDGLVAIGAPYDSSRGHRGGVVYIFDSEDWSLVHTLRHLFGEGGFWQFGHKVTNAGDGLVAVSTGLDYTRRGPGVAVQIFNAETGEYVRAIYGPPHALFFGSDLGTLENGNLVIGSRHEGIGPGQYSGAVYVYTSSGTQVHKIVRPDRMDNGFGNGLTVLKNDILASDYLSLPGALYRYSGETGNLVHTYTVPSSLSPAPASFGSPVATNESGHFITSAWFKENTEPPYGSSHLYDAQNRLTMILPTELKDVYRFGASVGMTDDTIAIEASSSRSYGGLFHGHILMFDKDNPTRPFAGIPRAILQSDRPNMVPFGDNDMLLQAAWPPPLPNHARNSLVYLVNMQSPAPVGGTVGSSAAADGAEGAGAEPKALEQTEPVGTVPPTGGVSPARFMPALLGFDFTDSLYDSAPDLGHAYMALRFTSSLDGLPVYPGDFEVTGKDGAWPLVLDVVADGNTATLVLDSGSLYLQPRQDDPDPDDFEVLVRAPWAPTPTDPESGNVEILGVESYSNALMLHWNMFGDNTEYKVVIAPASSPRSKTAYIVADTDHYMFVNLQPDTEYEVRVGVRGDDTTQSMRSVTTMPEGASPFLADLYPSVSVASDVASLQWLDINGVGEGRYRVERSVDGGSFTEIENQPGANTATTDTVDPEWRGKQIAYRVFEWVGNQKLYSDEISFVLR